MMEKTKDSSQAGERNVLPGAIIAMGNRSVNGLCPLKPTPNRGAGPLERGNRLVWFCRNYANQCSAFVSAVSRRTNGLSALTGVVSGCRQKQREKAARTGGDDM